MTDEVIGIFHDPWSEIRQRPNSIGDPIGLWLKAVRYRANPRPAEYMEALLADRYPTAVFLDVTRQPISPAELAGSSKIVLLYPDAIGLGYSSIERKIAREAHRPMLTVLNGRRRDFVLDRRVRWALRYRRFLEWTMLIECMFGLCLLLATPALLLLDLLRGKK